MAKTGYIINQGIQQVFTSGPFSGSLVTSSYSLNGNLIGPIIDTRQSFISGTLDTIYSCNSVYNRRFLDLYNCPPSGCPQPIISDVRVQNCESYDYKYEVTYNYISSSTYVPTTTIEYSTDIDFNYNTGSVTYDNTLTTQLPINVSALSPTPIATSVLYFRAFNNCIGGASSSYSEVMATACAQPTICCTPTLNSVTSDLGILTVDWTLGTEGCDEINTVNVQSSTDGNTWANNIGSPTSPRTYNVPTITTYYRVIANCSTELNSDPSNVIEYTVTPPPPPTLRVFGSFSTDGKNTSGEACATPYQNVILWIDGNPNDPLGGRVYYNDNPPYVFSGDDKWYKEGTFKISYKIDGSGYVTDITPCPE